MARPRKRPATPLSDFLDAALKHCGLNHNEFSQRVGMKPSTVSDLKMRQETEAPDRATIHQWAVVLSLSKADEERLFELVQLAYAPSYVQILVAQLRSRGSR